jgi:hypothetical protein
VGCELDLPKNCQHIRAGRNFKKKKRLETDELWMLSIATLSFFVRSPASAMKKPLDASLKLLAAPTSEQSSSVYSFSSNILRTAKHKVQTSEYAAAKIHSKFSLLSVSNPENEEASTKPHATYFFNCHFAIISSTAS